MTDEEWRSTISGIEAGLAMVGLICLVASLYRFLFM